MKSLLKHGNTRCSYGMLRLVNEMTLLFILMKYSRYTSHFIGLVHMNDLVVINAWWSRPMHICMLQVSRLWWYAKFVCYIEITLIGSVWISFLRISVSSISIGIFDWYMVLETCIGTRIFNWEVELEHGHTHLSVEIVKFLQLPNPY